MDGVLLIRDCVGAGLIQQLYRWCDGINGQCSESIQVTTNWSAVIQNDLGGLDEGD